MIVGTKWCGLGDVASGPDDVATGMQRQADLCCQEHDGCPYQISAFKYQYGVLNWNTLTM